MTSDDAQPGGGVEAFCPCCHATTCSAWQRTQLRRATLAAEVERWRRDWRSVELILHQIQETADGGGMAGHDGSEDLRRFRLISDLVDRIWEPADAAAPRDARES